VSQQLVIKVLAEHFESYDQESEDFSHEPWSSAESFCTGGLGIFEDEAKTKKNKK